MTVEAKICGITTPEAMNAAVANGARYVGLVFYPASPRNLTPDQAAGLAALAPAGVTVVGLFVDVADETFDAVLSRARIDLLQLHGGETPERVMAVKQATGRPVMKAIKLAGPDDLAAATPYLGVADRLLFDAKAPDDRPDLMPGGNALVFDWRLLGGRRFSCPWMLSGGLDSGNVAEAVRISGAAAVDVSSGVENAPGVKDPQRITEFLSIVAGLES